MQAQAPAAADRHQPAADAVVAVQARGSRRSGRSGGWRGAGAGGWRRWTARRRRAGGTDARHDDYRAWAQRPFSGFARRGWQSQSYVSPGYKRPFYSRAKEMLFSGKQVTSFTISRNDPAQLLRGQEALRLRLVRNAAQHHVVERRGADDRCMPGC
jgi:hypothetical protein